MHDIYGRRPYPYLFYDRMGKINRRLIEQKGYQRSYGAWVCRDWERTHDGKSLEEVRIVKLETVIPPPRRAYETMGFDPRALEVSRTEEEVVRCDTVTHGQLPNELRRRLGLRPVDDRRFRDIDQKTWWTRARERTARTAPPPRP
jgi:hypothetical protein